MEEILHHQKDVWNPINNGMFTTYQLVQDFETIHSITIHRPASAGPSPGGSAAEIRCVERCGCGLGPSVDVHGWEGWQIYLRL